MNKNNAHDHAHAGDELLLIESWLAFLEASRGHAVSTINKYRGYLKKLQLYLMEEHQGRLLLTNPEQLETFTGLWLHKKGVAPKSRHVIVAACKGFYKWLHEKEHIASDPGAQSSISQCWPEAA